MFNTKSKNAGASVALLTAAFATAELAPEAFGLQNSVKGATVLAYNGIPAPGPNTNGQPDILAGSAGVFGTYSLPYGEMIVPFPTGRVSRVEIVGRSPNSTFFSSGNGNFDIELFQMPDGTSPSSEFAAHPLTGNIPGQNAVPFQPISVVGNGSNGLPSHYGFMEPTAEMSVSGGILGIAIKFDDPSTGVLSTGVSMTLHDTGFEGLNARRNGVTGVTSVVHISELNGATNNSFAMNVYITQTNVPEPAALTGLVGLASFSLARRRNGKSQS